ncbi:GNAT family N-acetyltransferase [Shimia ponticola]|uniref:GNAT family N-acetyltransferase n=1 Tax=Shimia ponticola TaxID=2582893 RepID=UPI0011BF6EC1|nr:GNAT family N-acetyltransferase [Shimia ponticola]
MDISAQNDLAGDLFTQRLHLRRITLQDAAALQEAMGDFDILQWTSKVPYPFTVADAEAYIARHQFGFIGSWLILFQDRIVGGIAADDQLGYWITKDAWGQGIATEAAERVIDFVFEETGQDLLRAGHFDGNAASRNTLVKLGFEDEGADTMPSLARGDGRFPGMMMRLTQDMWTDRQRFELTTQRLRLRNLTVADAPRLAQIGGTQEVAPMMLSLTVPWPVEAAETWIESSRFRGRPGFRVGIELDGTLIGVVGLGPKQHDFPLMYFISQEHWRQGYAKEAVSAYINACFGLFPDMDRMTADHFTDNPHSGALLQKLGFVQTGTNMGPSAARLEPAPVIDYRLTRTDWEARR